MIKSRFLTLNVLNFMNNTVNKADYLRIYFTERNKKSDKSGLNSMSVYYIIQQKNKR